jgi:hypothetical protein
VSLNTKDVRRVAAEASCDYRTVQAYVDGKAIRPLVKQRIEDAAKKLRLRIVRRLLIA